MYRVKVTPAGKKGTRDVRVFIVDAADSCTAAIDAERKCGFGIGSADVQVEDAGSVVKIASYKE